MWILSVLSNLPDEGPAEYSFRYCALLILLFIFLTHRWILHSVRFVGSSIILINFSLSSVLKHFSIYFGLSVVATPLLLSCLSIRMSFYVSISLLFARSLSIFWYLYGTVMLLYLWQALRSFDFGSVIWLSRICERFGKMFR